MVHTFRSLISFKYTTNFVYGVVGCVVLFFAIASPVKAEEISQFVTDMSVTKDGVLHVQEKISYDFGPEYKHGIYRIIPTNIPDTARTLLHERYVQISQVRVTRDGVPTPFTLSESRATSDIKIGDANRTVTGPHEYRISYDVAGAMVHFTDGTVGLYWNAVGHDWAVPILSSIATLRAEPGILTDRSICYGGVYGSEAGCTVTTIPGGFQFTADTGGMNGNITFQHEIVANAVVMQDLERFKLVALMVVVTLIIVSIVSVAWYRFRFKNKSTGPVIAEYEPYHGVLPMQAGYIVDGSLDARDITAAVLYLAQLGYIQIDRLPDSFLGFDTSDYQLTLLKEDPTGPFLDRIIQLLFVGRPVGAQITVSQLKNERSNALKRSATAANLKSSLKESLFTDGYFERPYPQFRNLCKFLASGAFLVSIVFLSFQSVAGVYTLVPVSVAVIFGGLILLFGERRSVAGYEAKRQLRGFKLFLSVTGEARFAFHSDPRSNPDMFVQYLPYAVAFGVEKRWAEVFADIAISQPVWYNDTNTTVFNAVALTSSLDTFSTNFSRSLRTASTIQGGGRSSGSFGGGFSGGGGGGGGGGSW